MKRQIRRGVFETNSSSVHSLQILHSDEYNKWNDNDKYFMYTGYGWGFEFNKPEEGKIYTKEEAINFLRSNKYIRDDLDNMNEDNILESLHEEGFYDSEYYWDYYGCEFETYEKRFTTPLGDTMVAFGYYGHD